MKKIMVLVAMFVGANLVGESCCQKTCKATKSVVRSSKKAEKKAEEGYHDEGCSTCKKAHEDLKECSKKAESACKCLDDCCERHGHKKSKSKKKK